LVRAPDGSKMSKSKGNTVDPLGLIDQYGADALRFTLAAMESQGRDIKLDEQRVVGYRNFATKLWNAARFLQGNGVGASTSVAAPEATLAVNKWIIGETVETLAKLDAAFADLRYDAMADAIYHFAWGTFCDRFIEVAKAEWSDETAASVYPQFGAELRAVAAWAFDQILVMLHPFMPFVTEELWGAMGDRDQRLIHGAWPRPAAAIDAAAKADMEWLFEVVEGVRAAKNELGIAPGLRLRGFFRDASTDAQNRRNGFATALVRIARLEIELGEPPVGSSIQVVVGNDTLVVPLEGIIDLAAERTRLTKSADAAEKEAASLAARLANPAFVEKAKPEAIEKARADHAEKSAEAERLRAALARLG
jgi:valyl-tRNA synthetase